MRKHARNSRPSKKAQPLSARLCKTPHCFHTFPTPPSTPNTSFPPSHPLLPPTQARQLPGPQPQRQPAHLHHPRQPRRPLWRRQPVGGGHPVQLQAGQLLWEARGYLGTGAVFSLRMNLHPLLRLFRSKARSGCGDLPGFTTVNEGAGASSAAARCLALARPAGCPRPKAPRP